MQRLGAQQRTGELTTCNPSISGNGSIMRSNELEEKCLQFNRQV
jgi:hypothetical protein